MGAINDYHGNSWSFQIKLIELYSLRLDVNTTLVKLHYKVPYTYYVMLSRGRGVASLICIFHIRIHPNKLISIFTKSVLYRGGIRNGIFWCYVIFELSQKKAISEMRWDEMKCTEVQASDHPRLHAVYLQDNWGGMVLTNHIMKWNEFFPNSEAIVKCFFFSPLVWKSCDHFWRYNFTYYAPRGKSN